MGKYAWVGIRMNDLIKNIDKLHTTEMGVERIKRNCQIEQTMLSNGAGCRFWTKMLKLKGSERTGIFSQVTTK